MVIRILVQVIFLLYISLVLCSLPFYVIGFLFSFIYSALKDGWKLEVQFRSFIIDAIRRKYHQ